MSAKPYDERGRFIPLVCPRLECGGGTLRQNDPHFPHLWECDGLADPNDDRLPLELCWFHHWSGKPKIKLLPEPRPRGDEEDDSTHRRDRGRDLNEEIKR